MFALRCAPPVSQSVYKRIDHAVYRAERAVVVLALLVMAVVVFLDVVHRSFSGEESKFAAAVAKVGGWFGAEIVPDTARYQQLVEVSPYVQLVVFIGLAYFGIRSTKRSTPVRPPQALLGAIAMVLFAFGLVKLLLVVMPNGLIWSQTLALILTLWVGFVGASMCTYENRHLRVEAVQRFLPEKVRPAVAFASGLLTTLVCLVLLWLSVRYVRFNYQEYVATDGKGGLFMGMDVPKYLGFAALPIAFAFMAIRFAVKAIAALRGEVEVPIDPVTAAGGVPVVEDGEDPAPSDVATEAMMASRPPDGDDDDDVDLDGVVVARASAVETLASRTEMERDASVPYPQSKVPTDAHPVVPGAPSTAIDDDEDPYRTREVDEPMSLLEDTTEVRHGILGEPEEDDR